MRDLFLDAVEATAELVEQGAKLFRTSIAEGRNAFNDDEHGDYLRCAGADALAETLCDPPHDPLFCPNPWPCKTCGAPFQTPSATPHAEAAPAGGGERRPHSPYGATDSPAGALASTADTIRDVLSDHAFWPANHSSIGSNAHCLCGERPHGAMAWREHVARLIAKAIAPQPVETGLDHGASIASEFFPQHRK